MFFVLVSWVVLNALVGKGIKKVAVEDLSNGHSIDIFTTWSLNPFDSVCTILNVKDDDKTEPELHVNCN
jgi:hypothetical protein